MECRNEIVCIIDCSGSMDSIRSDAIGGFNSFLREQKEHPDKALFTLVLFNHKYNLIYNGIDLQTAEPLNDVSYVPSGTTALLDAVGRTIDDVGDRLGNTPEDRRPSKVIVAILTDGLENASRDYSRDRVFSMITHQREKYSWEFIFLAANQDAFATARALSIDISNTMSFSSTGAGIRRAHRKMSETTSRIRSK